MEGACWQHSVVGISFLTGMRGERWRGCRPWSDESVKTNYRLQQERRGRPRERHGGETAWPRQWVRQRIFVAGCSPSVSNFEGQRKGLVLRPADLSGLLWVYISCLCSGSDRPLVCPLLSCTLVPAPAAAAWGSPSPPGLCAGERKRCPVKGSKGLAPCGTQLL